MWLSHYFLQTSKFLGQKSFYVFSIFFHLEAKHSRLTYIVLAVIFIVNERISFHFLKLFFQDDKKWLLIYYLALDYIFSCQWQWKRTVFIWSRFKKMFSIFLIEFGDYIIISPLRETNSTIFFFPLSELNFYNQTGRRQGKSVYSFISKINWTLTY